MPLKIARSTRLTVAIGISFSFFITEIASKSWLLCFCGVFHCLGFAWRPDEYMDNWVNYGKFSDIQFVRYFDLQGITPVEILDIILTGSF
jgi:hypothetical protein